MACSCSSKNNNSTSTANNHTARDEATYRLYHKGLPIALVTVVEKEKFHGREVDHDINSICRVVEILDSCPSDIPLIVDYPKDKYHYVHELLPGLLIVWNKSDIRQIV